MSVSVAKEERPSRALGREYTFPVLPEAACISVNFLEALPELSTISAHQTRGTPHERTRSSHPRLNSQNRQRSVNHESKSRFIGEQIR